MKSVRQEGMTPEQALRLEYAIIGLGVMALIFIFQPFSLGLFAVGSGLVVLAALINNLLPLAVTGVPARSVVTIGMVVALIFCIVLLLAITAAHFYGVLFLKPPDPNTTTGKIQLATPPFYLQPLVWWLLGIAAVLTGVITLRSRR